MRNPMEVFEVELTAVGPVFVGSGEQITKKEYYLDGARRKIVIPDAAKFYKKICGMNKRMSYEKFIMETGRTTLGQWIQRENIQKQNLKDCIRYELDYGESTDVRDSRLQIVSFVKDAYGSPYVPGSSLKGMLRTILLAYDIRRNPDKYRGIKHRVLSALDNPKGGRKGFLKRETEELEVEAFNLLKRKEEKKQEKVNDVMAGILVGDSEPLALENLTLCQKIDYSKKGMEKSLPMLRECIKPETKILFSVTIDRQLCSFSEQYIMDAIAWFAENTYECFLSKYDYVDKPEANAVWLGGGSGFVSKTVIYPLFQENGVKAAKKIFKATLSPKIYDIHKHNMDESLGVSPHTLKLTQYHGKRYQFGLCRFRMEKIS